VNDHARHGAARAAGEHPHDPHGAAGHGGRGQGNERLGHAGHADVYRRRFWISLTLAVPVVAYSEMIQDWFGFTAPQPAGLESTPLEEVLLLRDELANMAWAVERVVESKTGRPLDRFEAYQARLEQERRSGEAPSAQRLAYRLATTVPDNWNPLLPLVLDAKRRLGLAAMRNENGELLSPLGELLRPESLPRPLALYDEEVPSAGAQMTRAYEYARSSDGSTYLWVSRRKRSGPGQASSGLRFDDLGPM
jgi:hypothetical protein